MNISYYFINGNNPIIPDYIVNLINNSKYEYKENYSYNYIKLNLGELEVYYDGSNNRFFIDDDSIPNSSEIENLIYTNQLPVYKGSKLIDLTWKFNINWLFPIQILKNSWTSLMILNQNELIGYFTGTMGIDKLNIIYNKGSNLDIRPDYRNKGLCKPYVTYTFSQVVDQMKAKYIHMIIGSTTLVAACRCYVQSAFDLGFRVFRRNDEIPYQEMFNKDECINTQYEDELKFIVA